MLNKNRFGSEVLNFKPTTSTRSRASQATSTEMNGNASKKLFLGIIDLLDLQHVTGHLLIFLCSRTHHISFTLEHCLKMCSLCINVNPQMLSKSCSFENCCVRPLYVATHMAAAVYLILKCFVQLHALFPC